MLKMKINYLSWIFQRSIIAAEVYCIQEYTYYILLNKLIHLKLLIRRKRIIKSEKKIPTLKDRDSRETILNVSFLSSYFVSLYINIYRFILFHWIRILQ